MVNGLDGCLAEGCVELDLDALTGAPVEYFAVGDVLFGHFFEAEALGAELYLVVVPFAFLAVFVLDRD